MAKRNDDIIGHLLQEVFQDRDGMKRFLEAVVNQAMQGEVDLKVPELRYAKFETAIIERYKRRESSVEEALMEMYLAGVSVRRIEDITEALWGMRVNAGAVSELNKKMYQRIEAWRNKPIEGEYPFTRRAVLSNTRGRTNRKIYQMA